MILFFGLITPCFFMDRRCFNCIVSVSPLDGSNMPATLYSHYFVCVECEEKIGKNDDRKGYGVRWHSDRGLKMLKRTWLSLVN